MLGLHIVPVVVILLSAGLHIPFPTIASFILVMSLVFMLFWKFKIYRDFNSREMLTHPSFYLMLCYFFLIYGFDLTYHPRNWDEFSYWLFHAKQIFYNGSVYSEHFIDKGFNTYTSGLPSLQALNQQLKFTTEFSDKLNFHPLFLFSLASLNIIYERLSKILPNLFAVMLAVIFIYLTGFRGELFKASALIEPACYASMFALFWLVYLFVNEEIDRKVFSRTMGLLLLGGFALKQYYLVAIPALAIWWICTQKTWRGLLAIVLPTAFFYLFWKCLTADAPPVHDFMGKVHELGFWQAANQRGYLYSGIPLKLANIFVDIFILSIVPAVGFWKLCKDHKKAMRYFSFFFLFFIPYLATMTWVYFFVSGPIEAEQIHSIRRYTYYFALPLAIVMSLIALQRFNWGRVFNRVTPELAKVFGSLTMAVLVLVFVLDTFKELQIPVSSMKVAAAKIGDYVDTETVENAYFVDTNQAGLDFLKARYYFMDLNRAQVPFKWVAQYNPNDAVEASFFWVISPVQLPAPCNLRQPPLFIYYQSAAPTCYSFKD
jgi:hypothetical protein